LYRIANSGSWLLSFIPPSSDVLPRSAVASRPQEATVPPRIVGSALSQPQTIAWTSPLLAGGGAAAWIAANAVTVALYFALGLVVSWFFAAYGLFPAPIWLPASVAILAAMIGDFRLVPGVFLGSFLTNAVLFAPPWHVTAIISTTNALGPLAAAIALRRLRPESGLFNTFPGVVAFLLCTILLSPAISAAGGAVALAVGQPIDLAQSYSIWVNWWLTDSGGTLYLAPALILWLGLEHETEAMTASIKPGFDRRDLAVWAWIALVSLVLFLTPPLRGSDIRSAFPFLLVVPLSWIALRMSLRSAYTLVSLVAIVATAGTVAGVGPFQNHSLANPLMLVGTLVVLLATNVLTIVALASERHQAQNANQVKAMFLANTSHELRTPLNAIIGFSSMMHGETATPMSSADTTKYARLIQSSGEHLLALINDLLAMSRIEAGRFVLEEENVSLADIIDEAVHLITVEARAKSIALEIDTAGAAVTVRVDVKALRQILLNLLSNAVKFTPEGGRVMVAATRSGGGDIVIRIADTGIGIPAEALECIFRPFERAHRPGAHRIEGTGLGLSITRGLVMLHGGTIALVSTPGAGTEVTVTLPASRVVATADAARPPQAAKG
jgi:two-component system, cell cycle sensor histidine kinase PleC